MSTSTHPAAQHFGTTCVAMVTPMTPDGEVSRRDVVALVDHLVAGGCDGIVVAGTTGEAPTLTLEETMDLVRTVAERVDGAARVVVGVGSNAEAAGADALLVVAPYYSRPSAAGVIAHFTAVADATPLPVMVYDVPVRTGIALAGDTLRELARHPRVMGIKDAKGDLVEAMDIMTSTGLGYYCGIDELNLPYAASGAAGVVSVTGNIAPRDVGALVEAVREGQLDEARRINTALAPLTASLMRPGPGAATAKAALMESGVIESRAVRLPLVEEPAPRISHMSEAS